jgi:hypothetical protein
MAWFTKASNDNLLAKRAGVTLKNFTELDLLEHFCRFKEFQTLGVRLTKDKLSLEQLKRLRLQLQKAKMAALDLPLDETSRNILIIDLFRLKERSKKAGFSPSLRTMILTKFRRLNDSSHEVVTLRAIALHCVEKILTRASAKGLVPGQPRTV